MGRLYQITGPDYSSFQLRKDLWLLCKASVNGRVRRKQTATQLLAERLGNMPKQLVSGRAMGLQAGRLQGTHALALCYPASLAGCLGLQQKVGCCFPFDKNTLKSLSGVLCAQPEAWWVHAGAYYVHRTSMKAAFPGSLPKWPIFLD